MNKQKIFLIVGLILIISISVLLDFSIFKKPIVSDDQNKIVEENKPINDVNKVNNEATSLCSGSSEAECFAKLSECIIANSAKDFLDTRGFNITLSDWPEKWTSKITPSIQTNFPNAEIFLNIQPIGGGDHGSFPFIKLENNYCELNQENAKIVFSPIKTKEDALKYYSFLQKKLGSAFNQSQLYIMKVADYDDSNIKYEAGSCEGDYRGKLQNRITEIKDINGGYLITFIGFNYMYQTEFFELKIQVNIDGTIKEISRNTLLDCGGGAVF
ncbi:MAG: hypothetical protein AAB526_02960 [Patescibacteria group bacterium]